MNQKNQSIAHAAVRVQLLLEAVELQQQRDEAVNLLKTVLDAHRYDGALTNGSALLSPALESRLAHFLKSMQDKGVKP